MKESTPKVISKKVSKLLAAHDCSYDELRMIFQYVRRDLNLKREKQQARIPNLPSDAEMQQFIDAVWASKNYNHSLIIRLMALTGIRVSELISIRLNDVFLDEKKIYIVNGKGGKARYVPIPEQFTNELRNYIWQAEKRNQKYLFEKTYAGKSNPFTRQAIWSFVKSYGKKVNTDKNWYPHLFRHYALTILCKNGMQDTQLQVISGHSDKNTLGIYQHLALTDVDAQYQSAIKNHVWS